MHMEYRKLISFGKNSYVVSLPKNWVRQNKLVKGDLVYIDENPKGLLLQAKQNKEGEEKKIIIAVDGKDIKRTKREIISAYVKDYKHITLAGKEIKTKAKEIQDYIERLVGLEIVEQDSQKIVARDFVDLKQISVVQIIKKMDVISRSILTDCKMMFKEDSYASICHRDEDINKFRFLVYRMVWYGLENPSTVLKNFNLSQVDLFNHWSVSYSIEQIGDCLKRIASYMIKANLNDKSQVELIQLLERIEKSYLEVLKAYYTSNIEIAHKIVDERSDLIEAADEFFSKNKDSPFIGYLMYNMKGLVVNVSSIARTIYQGMFTI